MPEVPGAGTPSNAPKGAVPEKYRTVGTVIADSSSSQKYVVTQDGVEKVSNFIANLLTKGPNAEQVDHTGSGAELQVDRLASGAIDPTDDEDNAGQTKQFMAQLPIEYKGQPIDNPWPVDDVQMANDPQGSQTGALTSPTENVVSCSVYEGTTRMNSSEVGAPLGFPRGLPDMGTWVGKDYPAKIPSGSTAYVTPGSGLLYQEVRTGAQKSGSLFLVTDTGLRYPVPNNNDGVKAGKGDQEVGQNQARLGYAGAHPPLILKYWSQLLSAGPSLNSQAARQPQAS
jgi:hypothetical protein